MRESEGDYRHTPFLTRREFLRGSANFLGALAVSSLLVDSRGSERLRRFENNTVHLDIAPVSPAAGISQPYYPSDILMTKRLLGDKYRDASGLIARGLPHYASELISRPPTSWYGAIDEIRIVSALARVDAYPGMVQGMGFVFENHGLNVITRRNRVLAELGYAADYNSIIPIQECIVPGLKNGSQFFEDAFGNKGVRMKVDADMLINQYQKYAGDERIVNFSMQVGDMDLIYHTNEENESAEVVPLTHPYVEIKGAYQQNKAVENMGGLARLAGMFPDKLFVCAAGNFGDDLVEAQQVLSDKLNNVMFVGQWTGSAPSYRVFGADMYVDNAQMGYVFGKPIYRSTTSTLITSSIASVLALKGLKNDEIKQILTDDCDVKTYGYDMGNIDVPVLSDLWRVKRNL